MLRIRIILINLLFTLPAIGQQYNLTGKIEGLTEGKVYLSGGPDENKTDSAQLKDGTFTFKGSIKEPLFYFLRVATKPYNGIGFFLAPGKTTIKANIDAIDKAVIIGNPYNSQWKEWSSEWSKITAQAGPIYRRLDSVTNNGKVKESAEERKKFDDGMESLEQQTNAAVMAFVKKYPQSPVSAFVIIDRYINYPNPAMADSASALLGTMANHSFYGKQISEHRRIVKKTAIGAMPDFAVADTSGKMLKLSSLRGKYVLVDFWASWCGPCRKENPNVVKAYQQYHDKGFDILSVSLDTKKDLWMKAVAKDHLTWYHVSDLKGWQSPVVIEYGVKAVPTSFLLDKDGKVIANDLRGEALEKKLKELMP